MRRALKGMAGYGRGSRASVKAQQRRCESAPGRMDLSEAGERREPRADTRFCRTARRSLWRMSYAHLRLLLAL
jgi:hypothetical protein